MKTTEAIYQRRSIKHFDPDFIIPANDEEQLLNATIQSPTAYNVQHWRFVMLKAPQLRQTICKEVGFNQSQMTEASLLILLVADVKAWQKSPERYWANTTEETQQMMTGMIRDFYDGREWLQRDEAQRSIGIACQTLMLAAKEMGYDSCPMMGFDIEGLAQIIKLPEDYILGPMVAIGKGIKPARPKAGQLSLEELIIMNQF